MGVVTTRLRNAVVVICKKIFEIVRYCAVFGFLYVFIIILFLLFLFSYSISITCAFISLFYYPLRDGFVFLVPHVDDKGLLPVSGATIKVKKILFNCAAIEK